MVSIGQDNQTKPIPNLETKYPIKARYSAQKKQLVEKIDGIKFDWVSKPNYFIENNRYPSTLDSTEEDPYNPFEKDSTLCSTSAYSSYPLDPLTKRVLGSNGIERFDAFSSYKKGWDFGQGKPLNFRSTHTLEKFIQSYPAWDRTEPSLFLTLSGNLQLNWEDKNGGIIEIEFGSDSIEYYLEAEDEEKSIFIKDLPSLIDTLKRIINAQ